MKLTELFSHGEGKYFVAYKENVWLFTEPDFDNDGDEITQNNMRATLNKAGMEIEDDMTWFDLDIMLSNSEIDNNVVVGQVRDNALVIDTVGNYRHSVASKTVLKVMDELDVSRVTINSTVFGDDDEFEVEYEHTREEFIKPLSEKYFYHGTSLNHLFSILKKGLISSPEQTNYNKILHEDKVFITLNPERAHIHATITATNTQSYPVIVKIKIPDVSKLVLDFDVAVDLYGLEHHQTVTLGYDAIHNYATKGNLSVNHQMLSSYVPNDELSQIRDKSSLNTKLGVFGYQGRIPQSMIKEIWIDEENIRNHILSDYGYEDMEKNIADFNKFTPVEFIEFYKDAQEEIEQNINDIEDEDEDDM